MSKLNQIVAVEKGIKGAAQRAVTNAYHDVQHGEGPMSGLTRTYQPRSEVGDQLPAESTKVQFTVQDKIDEVYTSLVRLFDVTATKDWGNAEATADIVVDGNTLLADVPPTYLLFLEKYLVDVRTFLSKLPLLDPAAVWRQDETTGLYRSEPVKTTRTRKVPQAHVLYEATDRHPAQVESFTVDEIVGEYTLTKFSGAIPKAHRDQLVERADKLVKAVKFAREEANTTIVEDKQVGDDLLGYIFDV
jgi:hypothetical protein